MATPKTKSSSSIVVATFLAALIAGTTTNTVLSDDTVPIPCDKSQLTKWFNENVKPLSSRHPRINHKLASAERGVKVVKVMKDGRGDFKTVTEAFKSIPEGNKRIVIVYIGSGTYFEKIMIEKTKPFATLIGDPKNKATLTFDGTTQRFGTVDSASLIVESDYCQSHYFGLYA